MAKQINFIKQISIILILLVGYSSANSQPGNDFSRQYGMGALFDVYLDARSDVILAGNYRFRDENNRNQTVFRLMKVEPENGDVVWDCIYPQDRALLSPSTARTVIELDDGGYVFGGKWTEPGRTLSNFTVVRTNDEGEQLWFNEYGEARTPSSDCYAVIETKGGSILACGRSNSMPFAMMIEIDGEAIWQRHYEEIDGGRYFSGMREIPNGYLLTAFGGPGVVLVVIDQEGEIVWQGAFENGVPYSLISCRNGGYAICGHCGGFREGLSDFILLRLDNRLQRSWWNHLPAGTQSNCLIQDFNDGFILVGSNVPGNNAVIIRTDRSGNFIWAREDAVPGNNGTMEYYGVVTSNGREIFISGYSDYNAYLAKMTLDPLSPQIISYYPELLDLKVLPDVEQQFFITAIDPQEDDLSYEWTIDGDSISNDSSIVHIFDDWDNTYEIKCTVTDGVYDAFITWHVTVTDLYVSAYSPDSLNLTLRRGQSVDFALDTVKAVEGDPVLYQWRKSNDFGEVIDAGTESRAAVAFLQSGHYLVEGLAYRGESSDAVTWSVDVHGVVWSFAPEDLALEVLPDSLVRFEVVPANPEDTSLSAQWFVDDEFAISDTLSLDWLFSYPVHSLHTVICVLSDSVESDTVSWTVTVRDLGVPSPAADPPRSAALLTVSPNPFNSTLTIKYQSVESAKSAVNIYDIAGREVARLVETQAVNPQGLTANNNEGVNPGGMTPFRNITWNASDVPAGVFFVRLQSGAEIATKKVVLIR